MLDSQEITMAELRNFYIRFIDGDDYTFLDTVFNTGTNDYKVELKRGDANGYTIEWKDYSQLILSNGRNRAVWRTTMEDVIKVHVHFNGTGPGDEATQTIVDGCVDATGAAVCGALNTPAGIPERYKREMYKMTKMLMIRLVMLLRDFHAE